MKPGLSGGKNISFDAEAQEQIRAQLAKHKAEQPKIVIDSDYNEEVRKKESDEFIFKNRGQELALKAENDSNRLASVEAKASTLSSYDGYLRHLKSQTIYGEARVPTPEDWISKRDSHREMADAAREDYYASNHASEMMKWAADKPEPLKTAKEAVNHQLLAERQLRDQAAAEVNRLWIQSPSSAELAEAQELLALKSKVVARLERSLELIQKGQ